MVTKKEGNDPPIPRSTMRTVSFFSFCIFSPCSHRCSSSESTKQSLSHWTVLKEEGSLYSFPFVVIMDGGFSSSRLAFSLLLVTSAEKIVSSHQAHQASVLIPQFSSKDESNQSIIVHTYRPYHNIIISKRFKQTQPSS